MTAEAQPRLDSFQPPSYGSGAPSCPAKPRLHLAILVDLSGSRRRGHNHHRVHRPAPLSRSIPAPPTQILHMQAAGATTALPAAVKIADRPLDLRYSRALPMLAVVSDAALADQPAVQRLITTPAPHRPHRALAAPRPPRRTAIHNFGRTTTLTVGDPVAAIADAAVTANTNA